MKTKDSLSIRKELILANYKGYALAVMNDRDRINVLRQWEVTIIAAIVAFTMGQNDPVIFRQPTFGVVLAFATLETLVRARMRLGTTVADEVWDRVICKDDDYILENYEVANKVWAKVPITRKLKFAFTSLGSPEFLLWNFVISITILLRLSRF